MNKTAPIPPTPVKIQNFSQLKKLIESYKTDDQTQPITVKTKTGPVVVPNDSKPITHKLLIEGFEQLASQTELMNLGQVDEDNEEYGGFFPTSVLIEEPQNFGLDRFIGLHFGGKRAGNKIVWDLPEGKFELDPWTLTLNKS